MMLLMMMLLLRQLHGKQSTPIAPRNSFGQGQDSGGRGLKLGGKVGVGLVM